MGEPSRDQLGFHHLKLLASSSETLKKELRSEYNTRFKNHEVKTGFRNFLTERKTNILFIETFHSLLTMKKVIEYITPRMVHIIV